MVIDHRKNLPTGGPRPRKITRDMQAGGRGSPHEESMLPCDSSILAIRLFGQDLANIADQRPVDEWRHDTTAPVAQLFV
ncbi:MAG: hypothetical protein KDH17_04200 [Rhodocyclaceae bacterium]|nr:hypothetical protein [Rhodocyclaceae bacterium]